MSFDWCLKEAEVYESKETKNKSPALVECWLDKSYKSYCNAALAAITSEQKETALSMIKKNLDRKRQFFVQNPQRCSDINTFDVEKISKYFHWVTYLKLVTDDSNDFEEIGYEIDQLLFDFEESAQNLSKDSILNAMAEGTHNNMFGVKAVLYYKIAKLFFSNGVFKSESQDFRAAKYNFEEVRRPVESFKKLFGESKKMRFLSETVKKLLEELNGEIEVVEEETIIEMTQAVGQLSLEAATLKHDEVMKQNENLDFDKVYYVYDLYHYAWTQVRDKDIELEAKLMSKMGTYHYKVLKLQNSKAKAREYLKKSIELGISLTPKNVTSHDWYKEAEENLREIQKETLKSENQKLEEEKKKYEKELTEVANFLDNCRGKADFQLKTEIMNIIDKYPPKTTGFKKDKIEKIEYSERRKLLLKTIPAYHPDKQPADDRLWYFTSDLISKFLFNQLKSSSTD
ncbi:uncharacterized protein LOC142352210 [Convolutriloba macropyga]|uniref:uncharacterized protein LOC142352210 n=1 Tax=Convolutriloba macropyga TaxID=536237 RepID=UPI003F522E5A